MTNAPVRAVRHTGTYNPRMTERTDASFADRLLTSLVSLLPTRLISRLARSLAVCRWPLLRRALIRGWCRAYPDLDLSEAAESNPDAYTSFEAFFTRELATGTRPMPDNTNAFAAPVDGTLGALGRLEHDTLIQSKGHSYSIDALSAGMIDRESFVDGAYATFYLAPADYHRVHMPVTGRLTGAYYIPGRLFGVSPPFVRAVPGLFARNERVILSFATEAGVVALVFVGAFIVGGIHTRWHGRVCPPHGRGPQWLSVATDMSRTVERGDYVGHFSIGSSVIVLCERGGFEWFDSIESTQSCRVGQALGVAKYSNV